MHLRLASRFKVLSILIAFSIFAYTVWIHTTGLQENLAKTWSNSSKTVVVFGDAFSDSGLTRLKATGASLKDRSEHFRWTEVLLKELGFDIIHNYAQTAKDASAASIGALTDNEVYANTSTYVKTSQKFLPDLVQQVQNWKKDKHNWTPERQYDHHIFAVTLGFQDVWNYAHLELNEAKAAVLSSVYSLFEQVWDAATSVDGNVTVVIPQLWDISFTPKFMSLASSHDMLPRNFSETQHKLVYLVQYWNMALLQYGALWPLGDLYIPDWNSWLLDQIRATQMTRIGLSDSLGLGTETPAFKDVASPCSKTVSAQGSSASSSQCERPRQYLWWDDMQFGSIAHQMLGELAVQLLKSNGSANAGANERASALNINFTEIAVPRLVPSLAPGN